jgi:RNase P/RNase MRP subunit POP5
MKSTYRPDYRYVYACIEGAELEGMQGRNVIKKILSHSLGMLGIYEIEPVVIECQGGHVIIRCIRGTESRLCAVLALIDSDQERRRIHIKVKRISGTLRSIAQKMDIKLKKRDKSKKKGK